VTVCAWLLLFAALCALFLALEILLGGTNAR